MGMGILSSKTLSRWVVAVTHIVIATCEAFSAMEVRHSCSRCSSHTPRKGDNALNTLDGELGSNHMEQVARVVRDVVQQAERDYLEMWYGEKGAK
jgi:hypothetical protein